MKELLQIFLKDVTKVTKSPPPRRSNSLQSVSNQYTGPGSYQPFGRHHSVPDSIPIMDHHTHSTIEPNKITINCAQLPNQDGRLPLHLAIERGLSVEEGLEEIIQANRDALEERDGFTGFYPFVLARNNMDLCYSLLSQYPAVTGNLLKAIRRSEDSKMTE